MANQFVVYELAKSLADIPVKPTFLNALLSQEQIKKKTSRKILKKAPIKSKKMDILGIEGEQIQLPITVDLLTEEEDHWKRALVKTCLGKTLDVETPFFVLPEEIIPYTEVESAELTKGDYLSFGMLSQIIERCVKLSEKQPKDIHYVVIDGEDNLSNYCIDLLYDKVNYLTMITDRPDYFHDKATNIYQETGLVVETIPHPLLNEIESDIVINCKKERDKSFFFFQKRTFVLDFRSNREHIRNMLVKRKDLQVVDQISIKTEKEVVSTAVLEAAIFSQHRALRSWKAFGYKQESLERIQKALNQYELQVKHFYQYGRRM